MTGGSHNRRSGRRKPSEHRKPEAATGCPYCRKRSYRTRKVARRALRSLYPGEVGLGMHVYPCGDGGDGWHIGHRTGRGYLRPDNDE